MLQAIYFGKFCSELLACGCSLCLWPNCRIWVCPFVNFYPANSIVYVQAVGVRLSPVSLPRRHLVESFVARQNGSMHLWCYFSLFCVLRYCLFRVHLEHYARSAKIWLMSSTVMSSIDHSMFSYLSSCNSSSTPWRGLGTIWGPCLMDETGVFNSVA